MAKTHASPTVDFVVVSNRLPVDKKPSNGGPESWVTTPGGLVAALSPLMREREAAWVGWPGHAGVALAPFSHGKTRFVPVELSDKEVVEHYEGFSNSTVWPLYHDAIVEPEFHDQWWDTYRRVNSRFAEKASEVAREGAFVWVHDYQLQLVPQMLRQARPDLTIGYFHHIPFPSFELFARMPWCRDILDGLLGADVLGVQRESDASHLQHAITELCGYSIEHSRVSVPVTDSAGELPKTRTDRSGATRDVVVGVFPISLDVEEISHQVSQDSVIARAKEIRQELGQPERIFLGVDRLDYTKGISHRLKAFGELLEEGRLDPNSSVFVQLASPSRERVESYRQLREDVDAQVEQINSHFAEVPRPPVVYRYENIPREEIMAHYLAADVMVVTPLRDGMNLVAKEFVAARADDSGVLVLSECAGAADEFGEALVVDPLDIESVKQALVAASTMSRDDQKVRMHALRRTLAEHDVRNWATGFIDAVMAARGGER